MYYITKEKKQILEKELKNLKEVRRKEIAEKLDEAKALGDLKENAEYAEARREQGEIEDRISEIEEILKNSKIVERKQTDFIEIGSVVELKKNNSKNTVTYEIVGVKEVDIFQNKISFLSPLGKELMGKKKGDKFDFTTPSGKKVKYEIVNIK